jgi:hypothetical protein
VNAEHAAQEELAELALHEVRQAHAVAGLHHRVQEGLQVERHPFVVGRGLEQNPCPGLLSEHGRDALRLEADLLLDQFAPVGQDADLAGLLVDAMPICSMAGLSPPRR